MESYNIFLYNKRNELGLSRKAFARNVHISYFKYTLIEKGYLKPSKRNVNSIEKYLNIDFKPYLKGAASYSTDLPEKEKRPIVKMVYDFIGATGTRIALIFIFLLSLSAVITSIIWTDKYETNRKDFYPEKIVELYDSVVDNGTVTLDLLNSLSRAEIFDNMDNYRLTMIKANYNGSRIGEMEFKIDYWTDDYRLTLVFNNELKVTFLTNFIAAKKVKVTAKYVDYTDNSYTQLVFYEVEKDDYELIKDSVPFDVKDPANEDRLMQMVEDIIFKLYVFNDNFNVLTRDKLGLTYDFYDDIFVPLVDTNIKLRRWENAIEIIYILGIIATLASLFGMAYSVLYGTKKGVNQMSFTNDTSSILKGKKEITKSDIKLTPFIPEIVLEFIGIIIVFIASLRIFYYYSMIIGVVPATMSNFKEVTNIFMPIFYLGMFLLYFIDFDTFVEDKRVIRNFFMYLLIYIGLYVLEIYLVDVLKGNESVVFNMVDEVKFPNMFGSIALYFLMMFLLFCTPKFINTKKRLIIFRSLSVLPAIIVLTLYFIFKNANGAWGWNLDKEILFLFTSERISFSLLCILYLYGLYFLRLFFKRKYGDKEAKRYFNGNRYIFLKNIMLSLIILGVAIVEYLLKDNSTANKLGFGVNYYIIFLIPFVIFYHPHKGERNFWSDIMTTILYALAISSIFIFIGITLLFG